MLSFMIKHEIKSFSHKNGQLVIGQASNAIIGASLVGVVAKVI